MTKGKYIRTSEIKKKYSDSHAGKVMSEETKKKISASMIGLSHDSIKGKNHPRWNHDRMSYNVLHQWVYSMLGKPLECEHCGSTDAKRYDWANKSGKYLKQVDDWIRLCRSCHIRYDDIANRSWTIRRNKQHKGDK